jgi:nitrous oxidase accessory protein
MKTIVQLFFLLTTLVGIGLSGFAKELEVCKGCPFDSIKEAVEKAVAGDMIVVKKGVYFENNIYINKNNIKLIGKGNPVIDGGNKNGIITIENSKNIHVEGFTLKNVEISYRKDFAAIRLINSEDCIIRNNFIYNSFFGIYLEKSDHCVIVKNEVKGLAERETSSGNAIHLWYSDYNEIEENYLEGHRDGIYLEFVQESLIRDNVSKSNLRYGLHFMFSNNNKYHHNTFSNNGAGVAVMYSKNIEMIGNKFLKNWGPASYGILLKEITDSNIFKNVFEENTIGLYAEGSNRLEIINNEFAKNGYAIKLIGSCEQVRFISNNFKSNTFEVSTSVAYNNSNTFDGNYWSAYTGYDLDKDGKGDVPHKPVKLFSYMMEKNPVSIVLTKSIFIELLEIAEKIAPSLTPEFVMDKNPSMKINNW